MKKVASRKNKITQRIVKIITENKYSAEVNKAAKKFHPQEVWKEKLDKRRFAKSFLVSSNESQPLIDSLQPIINKSKKTHILVLPVEASLPKHESYKADEKKKDAKTTGSRISREEIYNELLKNTSLDNNFLLLVLFSTIVAAVGLLDDNVAVLVGAMVIAPFLGPNLALAFSSALGDTALMARAIKTNFVGLLITLLFSFLVGKFWPYDFNSQELLSRTEVGYSGVILALASGAAGVLALTSGLSTTLVGVMVAVALLPPATTFGIMLGAADYNSAQGAALLLAVNVVCLNLVAILVFFFKGLTPRTWQQKKKAKKFMILYLSLWILSLASLILVIKT